MISQVSSPGQTNAKVCGHLLSRVTGEISKERTFKPTLMYRLQKLLWWNQENNPETKRDHQSQNPVCKELLFACVHSKKRFPHLKPGRSVAYASYEQTQRNNRRGYWIRHFLYARDRRRKTAGNERRKEDQRPLLSTSRYNRVSVIVTCFFRRNQ